MCLWEIRFISKQNLENRMKNIWIGMIALVTAGFAAQATPVAVESNFDTVQPATRQRTISSLLRGIIYMDDSQVMPKG